MKKVEVGELYRHEAAVDAYFRVLAPEGVPDFILEYAGTPAMLKQQYISVTCGMFYTRLSGMEFWYSSLEHAIGVGLVVWHFTHDKRQALAGLFHDIATPAFKHCIDFLHGDAATQESTEDLTREIIEGDAEIMRLLRRDGITVEEVCDYHKYPIADNDTPRLSADRLEYTLSNMFGVYAIGTLDEAREIYEDIKILEAEDGAEELGFSSLSAAEKLVEVTTQLSLEYRSHAERFSMQFIADAVKKMVAAGRLSEAELYEFSEEEVIGRMRADAEVGAEFRAWERATEVLTAEEPVAGRRCIKVENVKLRYIDPLVETEDGVRRVSELSSAAEAEIMKNHGFEMDKWLYLGA